MPLMSYYDTEPSRKSTASDERVLLVLYVVNATFSATTMIWWTMLSNFVDAPITWATWRGINSQPNLFDYPYVLLWLLPAAGIASAWIASKGGRSKLACWFALFPIVLLGLIFGWFYLTPWR